VANCLCCYWFLNSSRCIFPFLPDRHYQSGRNIRNHISKMKGHLSEKHSTSVRFSRKNHAGIESPVLDLPQKSLHTGAFTQSAATLFTQTLFYTQTPLHTEVFTYRSLYIEQFLQTNAFTHRSFCTQKLIFTSPIIFYTQMFLHKEFFAQKHFYTQTPLHAVFFTHSSFWHYIFYTKKY